MKRSWGKETLYAIGKNVSWYSHYENSMVSEKCKIKLQYDLATPLLGIHPKKIKPILKKICVCIYCSIVHSSQDMETAWCLFTDEFINSDSYIHQH